MVVIARDKDEPYVAGDEGIGNRRDRPAVEIGVEDGKIEGRRCSLRRPHRPGRGTAFDFGEKILLPRTMGRVCLT